MDRQGRGPPTSGGWEFAGWFFDYEHEHEHDYEHEHEHEHEKG